MNVDDSHTTREFLRVGLLVFSLFLVWRFLAGIVTTVLLLSTGLLLAVALSGPVEILHRRKVPRPIAAGLVTVVVLALLSLGGYLLLPELAKQASQLSSALPSALSRFGGRIEDLASRFGVSVTGGETPSASTLAGWGRPLLGGALGLFKSAASIVLGSVVVVFVAFYLAASPNPAVKWVVRLFPPDSRPRALYVLADIRASLLGWLVGRLLSMVIVGILATIALHLIGIPGALVLGIFTALVDFVPFVGPIVAAIPPLLLALVGGPLDAVWVLLAYVAIQQVEGNLITPLIMEKTASLHPAVVIVAVTVLGTAFGFLGALLALPATVVAAALVEELWFRRLEGASAEGKVGAR
jgi:predicted PurR-regulated permease PerM